MMNDDQLISFLDENSTERFFIEYGGYLSNHLAHGIISLKRLGADKDRIVRFIKWYLPKLEASSDHLDEKELPTDEVKLAKCSSIVQKFADCSNSSSGCHSVDDIQALLGLRCSYYIVRDVYERELTQGLSGDVDELVRKHFPALIRGFAASALHGLIHLGYGCAAQCPRVICEGLAYLHHSYLPFCLSDSASSRHPLQTLGHGTLSVGQLLNEMRTDKDVIDFLFNKSDDAELALLETSSFQRYLRALFTYKADVINQCVFMIEFPQFWDESPLDEKKCKLVTKLMIDCALMVYVMSERRNDFFLIHGVTSAFALRQILLVFRPSVERERDVILDAIRMYLCTLVATYMAQGAAPLESFPDGQGFTSWPEMIETTLSEDRDEHIYKLVQICQELDQETEDIELKEIYKSAVVIALNNELVF